MNHTQAHTPVAGSNTRAGKRFESRRHRQGHVTVDRAMDRECRLSAFIQTPRECLAEMRDLRVVDRTQTACSSRCGPGKVGRTRSGGRNGPNSSNDNSSTHASPYCTA